MNNIWFIFLGGFLTFASGYLVEFLKNRKEWGQKKNNFRIYIELELKALSDSFGKLKNNLEAKRYFDLLIINILDQSVSNLQLSKKEAFYLENYTLQEKILNILSEATIFLNDLRGLENIAITEREKLKEDTDAKKLLKDQKYKDIQSGIFKNNKDLEDFLNVRRTEKLVELIDLKRRIDELLKEIK